MASSLQRGVEIMCSDAYSSYEFSDEDDFEDGFISLNYSLREPDEDGLVSSDWRDCARDVSEDGSWSLDEDEWDRTIWDREIEESIRDIHREFLDVIIPLPPRIKMRDVGTKFKSCGQIIF